MSRTATLVLGAIGLFASTPAAAEILVGINGGFVIPGDQDLVFKEYSSGGGPNPNQKVSQDKVSESIGPIVGLQATGWGGWSFLRYFGVQTDALYWYMHARAEPSPPAPHFTVSQNRLAFFGSLLARVPVYPLVGRFSPDAGSDLVPLWRRGNRSGVLDRLTRLERLEPRLPGPRRNLGTPVLPPPVAGGGPHAPDRRHRYDAEGRAGLAGRRFGQALEPVQQPPHRHEVLPRHLRAGLALLGFDPAWQSGPNRWR